MFAPTSKTKSLIGCATLLILISILAYFNSLKVPFQFDDVPLIKSHWLTDTKSFFDHPRSEQIGNRPILYFSFALNNQLARHKVFGFHLINLGLHIGVTLLIFFIIWRARYLESESGWSFPLLTALLFSLHPLNTDSVSYISSRSSLLATFFYLLSIYFFLHLFCPNKTTGIVRKIFISILVISGMYLSVASKLIGATLPVMLAVWYWSFIGRKQFPDFHKTVFKGRFVYISLTSVAVLIIGLICFYDSWVYMPLDQGFELFGRTPYFMVQLKVIVFYYLRLFYFPFNLNVDSGFPFSSPMTDPAIIISGLLIFAIVWAVVKWRNVWVVVGAIWFFITLAPTSSFIPLNDLAVEHRMYLPMSLGLSLMAGVWINKFTSPVKLRLLVTMMIMLGITTVNRNTDWISELSLWKDSAVKNPFSPRPHNNAGKAYYEKGNLAKASYHFEKSVANIPGFIANQYNINDPESYFERKNKILKNNVSNNEKISPPLKITAELVEPHYNLASVYLDQGRLDEAEKEYLKTQALRPGHFSSKIGLSSVYNRKGLYDKATLILEEAVRENITSTDPGFALARLNLGELYGKTGKIEKAIIEWEAALTINPSLLQAHFNLGTAYMMTKKLNSAENSFKYCLNLNSGYEPALFNLAKVYQMQEKWDDSNQQFQAFLNVKGPMPSVYTHIGFNYSRLMDWEKARSFLEKSISLQPGNADARIYLAEVFTNLGEKEKALEQLKTVSNPSPDQFTVINNMMLSLKNDSP